ncbi:MAG: hypothetical protein Q9212_005033 [Teloschistes hypoglaucus]
MDTSRAPRPQGLSIREEVEALERNVKALNRDVATIKEGIEELNNKEEPRLSPERRRLGPLEYELEGGKQQDLPDYLKLRMRFLAMYVRNFKPDDFTQRDQDIIDQTNELVHDGGPVSDAQLYMNQYGVGLEDAHMMRDKPAIISIFKTHAIANSSTTAVIPPEFYPNFEKLLAKIREKKRPADLHEDRELSFATSDYWKEYHRIQWPKPA